MRKIGLNPTPTSHLIAWAVGLIVFSFIFIGTCVPSGHRFAWEPSCGPGEVLMVDQKGIAGRWLPPKMECVKIK